MISFIIIGRNEGWKLTKCLQSVFDTATQNTLNNYEVIYVDSKSTDDSIEVAKSFDGIKIFKLTGDVNAAIARNVGAKEAKGGVLFFIDGDMEINSKFLQIVYSEQKGLEYQFISGNWENYFYNDKGKLLSHSLRKNMDSDTYEYSIGGLFLIDKPLWIRVGGMQNVFVRSQDVDLGLRMSRIGFPLLRKKEIAANHHTISYLDNNRMWKDLFNLNYLYSKSLIYRKHIFNSRMYKKLLREDYSMIVLLVCIFMTFFINYLIGFVFYSAVLIVRTKFDFQRFIFFFLRDLSSLLGIFFFFPKSNSFVEYHEC